MMLRPLALLVIVLAACLPGFLALGLWRKRFAADPVEFVFAGLSLGLFLIGWLALLLAELAVFSLATLGAVWAVVAGALAAAVLLRVRREGFQRPLAPQWNRWEMAALLVWGITASVVYFRPHEFIIGGADAGVYINLGANIAKTGSILIHDPLLGGLDPELRPALLRAMPTGEAAPYYLLPGFYVTGSPPDLITPQFFHLHPAWQAVGYALGGLRAELWVTPLWGLLGCLAVYMTVRTLWGWRPALVALLVLSATALQVWFARYPTAEVLTQYLFWTGTWALIQWFDRRQPASLWAALAGIAFGQVFLTRIDTYVLLALPVLLAGWFTLTRTWRRDAVWFFIPLLLLAGHSLLHGWLVSQPYFTFITQVGIRALLRTVAPAAVVGLILVAAVIAWVRLRPGRQAESSSRTTAVLPVLLRVAALAVVVLALYAYFVRPAVSEVRLGNYWYGGGKLPNLDKESFARLGWYLSPLGLALGVGGIALMLVREANRRTAFLLLAGCFFSLIFFWRIGANPHQVYAMRRYVPQVLPFFVVSGIFLLMEIYRARGTFARWIAIGLTAAWIVGIVMPNQVFLRQVDYQGLAEQVSRLNAAMPTRAVVLFNDAAPVGVADFIGTPLRFLHGRPVFLLRQGDVDPDALTGAIDGWRQAGYEVVLLQTDAQQPWPLPPDTLGKAEEQILTFANLENTYDGKPARVLPGEWRFVIRPVENTRGSE